MSKWSEQEARDAMTVALGDNPEWFDGVTYGVSIRVGRFILDLRNRVSELERERNEANRVGKWSDEQARKAFIEASGAFPESMVGDETAGRAILDLRERAEKAEQRCAALEAALRIVADVTTQRIYASDGDLLIALERKAAAALSGDTSALREMLEKAAFEGIGCIGCGGDAVDRENAADIAKRVMEGK